MAVNPTLASDQGNGSLFPLPQAGETMIMKRDNIVFECTLPRNHKLSGTGSFFLSSKRIVFIASKKSCRPDFKSFEAQLSSLYDYKFNQPIFGANFLSGRAGPSGTGLAPDPAAAPLGGVPAPFSLTFNSGGCGTFLSVFYRLMGEIEENHASGPSIAQEAQNGRVGSVAYVDPSDPSVLYVSQPQAAPDSVEMTNFQSSAPPPEALEQFVAGDIVEVVILDGQFAGNWAKCTVDGPGSGPGVYNVRVHQTTDFNAVNGFAGTLVENVSADHLRKEGAAQPMPQGTRGGGGEQKGCAIS